MLKQIKIITSKVIASIPCGGILVIFIVIESCHMSSNKIKKNEETIYSTFDCPISICNSKKNKVSFEDANNFFTIENLTKVGPVSYLKYLKNFTCYELQIPSCRFPKNWVKKNNLPELKLLLSDTTNCPKIWMPSLKSYTINIDSVYINGSTISQEAKKLINSYLTTSADR